MDPRTFRVEHARLTTTLAEALAIEERLQAESDQGQAQAAAGQGLPLAFSETRWLLTRRKEETQKIRNSLDRVEQRRKEAITARTLELLRRDVPDALAKAEACAAFEFDGDLGALVRAARDEVNRSNADGAA